VDVTGNIFNDPHVLPQVLRIVGEDEHIDALVVMTALVHGKLALRFAEEIVALHGALAKPILLCWSAPDELARDAYARVDAAAIPRYPTPTRAARALSALSTFAEARRRHALRRSNAAAAGRREIGAPALPRGAGINEHQAKELLAHYGIRVTRERIAASKQEAILIAGELGYPVALKVSSVDLPHKTECGGVRIGIRNAEDVAVAYDQILADARAFDPDARIDGVLVQEMIHDGVETIVGATNDPRFGPAIMFGLGGIHTEVLRDLAFRICPIDRDDAQAMIREIRGRALLQGARGARPADVGALADALLGVSALAMDMRDVLAELDINPLFVLAEGQGVVAADALLRTQPPRTDDPGGTLAPEIGAFA
jgi:acyl-CoA synthetase (NDP forming)